MRRTNISDFINSDDSDPFSAVTVTFKPEDDIIAADSAGAAAAQA